MLGAFRGRSLEGILEVVVSVGETQFVLPDTAVFVFEDGIIQVLVDVHEKGVVSLDSLDDVVVTGEYRERTGVSSTWALEALVVCPPRSHLSGA